MSNTVIGVVKYHHENWDGTGYLYGLKGEDIPLCSRIMRICDSFEAMNANRKYRKTKFTYENSLEELINKSGTEFDPYLVKLFIDVFSDQEMIEREVFENSIRDMEPFSC